MSEDDSFYFFDDVAQPVEAVTVVSDLKSGKVQGVSPKVKIAPAKSSIFVNEKNIVHISNAVEKGTKVVATFRSAASNELPPSWVNYLPQDRDPYRLATPPGNQQLCGCCFAFALANTISDVFVFGRSLPFNPSISPLAIMSCLNNPAANQQCRGGDLLTMLGMIAKQGITTSQCLNYDAFCADNTVCTGTTTVVESATRASTTQTQLTSAELGVSSQALTRVVTTPPSNKPIPPCGCCSNCATSTYFTYFVDGSSIVMHSLTEIPMGSQVIPANPYAVADVKRHLLQYGAAVTSIVVYPNLVGGNFGSTRNIYFESEPYDVPPGQNPREITGGHMMSIVGWGVEPAPIVVHSSDGSPITLTHTPYWVVRNSWSTNWGMGGYFRMAMYQAPSPLNGNTAVNPTTALEMSHTMMVNSKPMVTMGIVVFRPGGFGTFSGTTSNCSSSDCTAPNPMTVPTISSSPSSSTSPPTSPPTAPSSSTSPPTAPSYPTPLPTAPTYPTSPPTAPTYPTSPPTSSSSSSSTPLPTSRSYLTAPPTWNRQEEEQHQGWVVTGIITALVVIALVVMFAGKPATRPSTMKST